MLEFILANVAMICAGVVLYLLAHSLPRIGETETEPKGIFERWVASELPERLDGVFNSFAGKLLRKLRVMLLKFDNAVSESLKKVRSQENGSKDRGVDFKEIMGDKESAKDKSENENEGNGKN